MAEPLIRSKSDTDRWVAYPRATESEQADATFTFSNARRLAGKRGELIGPRLQKNAWAVAVRTNLFDGAINRLPSHESVDTSVIPAAFLYSRPYRLELPASLHWVEVDLPVIVYPKRDISSGEKPPYQRDIIQLHLGDEPGRCKLFCGPNQRSQFARVMSQGLLACQDEGKVTSLAADLHDQLHFRYWLLSSRALAWVNRKWRHRFKAANSPMTFASEPSYRRLGTHGI